MENASILALIQESYDLKTCLVVEGRMSMSDSSESSRIHQVIHRQIYHKNCKVDSKCGTTIVYNLSYHSELLSKEQLSVEQLFAKLESAHYTPCRCELGRSFRDRKP